MKCKSFERSRKLKQIYKTESCYLRLQAYKLIKAVILTISTGYQTFGKLVITPCYFLTDISMLFAKGCSCTSKVRAVTWFTGTRGAMLSSKHIISPTAFKSYTCRNGLLISFLTEKAILQLT